MARATSSALAFLLFYFIFFPAKGSFNEKTVGFPPPLAAEDDVK
jgi:hypothetical protein